MSTATVTAAFIVRGPLPAELTGVTWPDGETHCRAALTSGEQIVGIDRRVRRGEAATVLEDLDVTCDRCHGFCD